MKKISYNKHKWLLTATLLAVLSMNYVYQESSVAAGSYEMSSTAASNEMETLNQSYMSSQKPSEMPKAPKPATAPSSGDRSEALAKIEAAVSEPGACTTGECRTSADPSVTIKLADFKKLVELARSALAEGQNSPARSEKPAEKPSERPAAPAHDSAKQQAADEKEDCNKIKSRQEKRECLAEQKREKEKEKQDAITEKFEDKMEDIKDKCDKDLECLATEFTSALSRFDGRNAVPATVVSRYFKSMIASRLSGQLFSENGTSNETLQILSSLMSDIPERYKSIKTATMDAVRSQALQSGSRVNQAYKNAQELSKQNNPQAYLQQVSQAREEHQMLDAQTKLYSGVIEQSLREISDTSALSYYQRTYYPNMQKIMMSLLNPNGVDANGQTQTTAASDNTRNTRSGGQGTTTTTTTNGMPPVPQIDFSRGNSRIGNDGKIAPPSVQNPVQWSVPATNNGMNVGTPTNTTRGGRGSY